MSPVPRWTPPVFQRGFDRLNALSDGVVAIAITLLVFPITGLATADPGANVLAILNQHSGKFITFFITFLVIAKLWVDNHGLYRDIQAYTPPLMWTHIVWLLAIVFIPFPMDVLSSASDTKFPNSAVYVGTLLLATAALFVEYTIAFRTPALQEEDVNLRPGFIGAVVDVLFVLVAFILTVTVPHWGLKPLLLLIPGGILGRALGYSFGEKHDGDPDRQDA
ncbi:hypothetical protein AX769_03900 [Frondihabitans sp. PAMC 28766]|uniref:TMEM175 family protein n=1 Tax=Frondihabitans sp. PAMC 28766 TaxID=1795630 RepID=UPI00078C7A0C|nr:TMEM175 family protein [Frondihabitans sp. PAMC 28766]AMM19442.1 hypothetical protein AX769_03900 [Frondihabitans sp. PAMC 28766]